MVKKKKGFQVYLEVKLFISRNRQKLCKFYHKISSSS